MTKSVASPFTTPAELSKRWKIDKKTVLGGIHRKEIPCTPVGRRWLIPLAWVEAREAAATADVDVITAAS